jgi:hypothetical protein
MLASSAVLARRGQQAPSSFAVETPPNKVAAPNAAPALQSEVVGGSTFTELSTGAVGGVGELVSLGGKAPCKFCSFLFIIKSMKKPKETPPFAYDIRDPDFDVTYHVFSYEAIKTKRDVWHCVALFLGNRKRQMPVNWKNLPREVKLLVTQDGKVRAFDLPTQQQLENERKIQNRQKKRIEKFLARKGKKK